MLNDVFERTWGERAGARPADEYWPPLIAAVKAEHPDFVFLAEAYWDLEYALQQQGFDYCYDKRLYDRLMHDGAEAVRGHLTGDPAYQERLLRFIENHDEPRAAARFRPAGPRRRRRHAAQTGRAARPRRPARRPRACSCRSSSGAGPTSSPTPTCARSTGGCSRRSTTTSSAPAPGSSASAAAGRERRRWRNLLAWGWRGDGRASSSS